MRILIDAQCLQTDSKYRGIGQYTMAFISSLLGEKKHHVTILLSGSIPIDHEIMKYFATLARQPDFVFFYPIQLNNDLELIEQVNCQLYRKFVKSVKPEVLIISSYFEGFLDGTFNCPLTTEEEITTAAIIYDAVPKMMPAEYLNHVSDYSHFYERKFSSLEDFDNLFAISETTKSQFLKYNSALDKKITIVYGGATHIVEIMRIDSKKPMSIIVIGGGELRKNIKTVTEAIEILHENNVHNVHLHVVGPYNKDQVLVKRLRNITYEGKLTNEEFEKLYQSSKYVIAPSINEGLDLVVLNAIASSRVVIASDIPVHREVLGPDYPFYFSPRDPNQLAELIEHLYSKDQEQEFAKSQFIFPNGDYKWSNTIKLTLDRLESIIKYKIKNTERRRRLAIVSPWVPSQTGIADYVKHFIENIDLGFDIDIITEYADDNSHIQGFNNVTIKTFIRNYPNYDHVIYHLGNSHFHDFMKDLIYSYPGILVMHDQKLGGWLKSLDTHPEEIGIYNQSLFDSHGYLALIQAPDADDTKLLLSRNFLNYSLHTVVHSEYAQNLILRAYPEERLHVKHLPFLPNYIERNMDLHENRDVWNTRSK
jgi:hypothetical protein